jgi:hypothetical protein
MTRLTHLVTTLASAGLCAGAIIAACGNPGEMPPLAPRPEPVRPNTIPMPGAAASSPVASAPAATQPSPIYQGASESQPTGNQPSGATQDAGVSDGSITPLPPLRDGSIPADSRMEPILQRDGGP